MIGVMLVATGGDRYTNYIPQLFASLRTLFPPNEVILFTNNGDVRPRMKVVMVDNYGWPRASLMRYHMFLKHRELLSQYSHLFYMDIDMVVKSKIEESEICGTGITAVLHPGFVGNPVKAYCRDPRSTAFVGGNKEYYQGCFQGGSANEFFAMCETLRCNIDVDDSKGVMAEWFDEGHLNRYLFDNPPTISLSPIYAYPEKDESYPSVQGQTPKIMHLQKHGQENWK